MKRIEVRNSGPFKTPFDFIYLFMWRSSSKWTAIFRDKDMLGLRIITKLDNIMYFMKWTKTHFEMSLWKVFSIYIINICSLYNALTTNQPFHLPSSDSFANYPLAIFILYASMQQRQRKMNLVYQFHFLAHHFTLWWNSWLSTASNLHSSIKRSRRKSVAKLFSFFLFREIDSTMGLRKCMFDPGHLDCVKTLSGHCDGLASFWWFLSGRGDTNVVCRWCYVMECLTMSTCWCWPCYCHNVSITISASA